MTVKRASALLCAGLILMASSAQAVDRYAMPPPGYTPEMSSDEAGIWMQVDKQEAQIKTSPQLVRDEKLNAYVSGLVCKLAGEYCPSIRVYILDVPEFNAFAMPNGAVVVYTGLLLETENEAQLAFVLGHEITHYLHRHSLEHLRMAINTTGFWRFSESRPQALASVRSDPSQTWLVSARSMPIPAMKNVMRTIMDSRSE